MSDDALYRQLVQNTPRSALAMANTYMTTHSNGEVVGAEAVSFCSVMILKLRKPDGKEEISVFHFAPDGVTGSAEVKLREIAATSGEKTAVFVTNDMSIGNIKEKDPEANALRELVSHIVPDTTFLETIKTRKDSGMNVFYLPRSGEVLVHNYADSSIDVHRPFAQQQGQGQGQSSSPSK